MLFSFDEPFYAKTFLLKSFFKSGDSMFPGLTGGSSHVFVTFSARYHMFKDHLCNTRVLRKQRFYKHHEAEMSDFFNAICSNNSDFGKMKACVKQ